ncbi:MAG TPA: 30S ribosome-binding factor RbfA [Acidimicrobiales bacterium]|jgi:ribosome-binding factor A
MARRIRSSNSAARDFPRTARLNQLIHEIVAEEIERIDDDRLGFLTVVAVEVEADIRRAIVWYSTLSEGEQEVGHAPDEQILEALEDHRRQIQAAIARQARLKRTPELMFKVDLVTRQAVRLESILRDIAPGKTPDP